MRKPVAGRKPTRRDEGPPRSEAAPSPDLSSIDAALASEEEEYGPPPLGPVAVWVRRLAIIVLFPAFAFYYLSQALTIKLPHRELLVSPRGFPTTVAIAMVVVTVALAAVEIVRLVRRRLSAGTGATPAEPEDDDRERITSWRDTWVTLAALAGYIAVFAFLGFAIATFGFLAALSNYLDPRHWVRNLVVSALFSVAVYLLFANGLGVQLPGGLLDGIL